MSTAARPLDPMLPAEAMTLYEAYRSAVREEFGVWDDLHPARRAGWLAVAAYVHANRWRAFSDDELKQLENLGIWSPVLEEARFDRKQSPFFLCELDVEVRERKIFEWLWKLLRPDDSSFAIDIAWNTYHTEQKG
jgi:hypothetical protein